MVADALAQILGAGQAWKTKGGAEQLALTARGVVLVKPLTFMNVSGDAVQPIAHWYKADAADVLVVSDELDLPFGRMRLRGSGGSGGHNGLKSIIAHFGEGFPRLRLGIGRGAVAGPCGEAIEHVLAPFSAAERACVPEIVAAGAEAALRWLDEGLEPAMQFANTWDLAAAQSE
jgi:PTH1 family peptidyl-tRNA hydrolase